MKKIFCLLGAAGLFINVPQGECAEQPLQTQFGSTRLGRDNVGDLFKFKSMSHRKSFNFGGYSKINEYALLAQGNGGIFCNIRIPEEVTTIANECFKTSRDSFFYIDDRKAKYYLTNIVITENVEKIGDRAFENCTRLSQIEFLTSKIQELQQETFKNCSNLTTVTIPSSVTKFGDSCFEGCKYLNSINLQAHNISLGNYCFTGCLQLSAATINAILKKTTKLGDYCFSAYKFFHGSYPKSGIVDELIIPSNITKISNGCFAGRDLRSIIIETDNIELGDRCFEGCNLSEAAINAILRKATKLGNGVFYCLGRSSPVAPVVFQGNGLFRSSPVAPVVFQKITIPENLAYISENCFYRNNALSELNLQANDIVIGKKCFEQCENLKTLNINARNIIFEEECFQDCSNLETINMPNAQTVTFGKQCFRGCDKIKNINMQNVVTVELHDFCFTKPEAILDYSPTHERSNFSHQQLYIPHSYTRYLGIIPKALFKGFNETLTNVNIQANDIIFEDDCFSGCTNLKNVRILNNDAMIKLKNNCFYSCPSLSTDSVNAILERATEAGANCFDRCSAIQKAFIGSKVKALGDSCFENCNNLSAVYFKSSDTALGNNCFNNCPLSLIYVPTNTDKAILENKLPQINPKRQIDIIAAFEEIENNNRETHNITGIKEQLELLTKNATKIQKSYVDSTNFTGYTARSIVQETNTQLAELLKQLSALKDSL